MTELTPSAARYSTPSTSTPFDTSRVAEIEWRMDVAESLRRLGDQQDQVVTIVERLAARPYRVPVVSMPSSRSRLGEAWDSFVEVPVALQAVFWVFFCGLGILIGVAIS